MTHQLLHHAGRRLRGFVEFHGGERGKLLARQAQQLELGATRLDRDARFAGGRHPHRTGGQLARDVHQLLGRQGHRTVGIDLSRDGRAHRDVEVCSGQAQTTDLLRGFDQDIGQHGERRFGGDGCRHRRQAFLQLFARDRELHTGRVVSKNEESL